MLHVVNHESEANELQMYHSRASVLRDAAVSLELSQGQEEGGGQGQGQD